MDYALDRFSSTRHGWTLWLGAIALCGALCGCSETDNGRKPTYPVTGQLFVDKKPAAQVQITLHDVNGVDQAAPTYSSTFSGEDGKFALSTYEEGDGVPEGEYVLTFLWGQMNMMSMQYGGPDKLKDKYSDPKTSTIRVKVEKGKPADLGAVELSTE
ncbi:MAG: hypothetical protein WD872_04820 [Pirellulaceae bacterium]